VNPGRQPGQTHAVIDYPALVLITPGVPLPEKAAYYNFTSYLKQIASFIALQLMSLHIFILLGED
jgi:hypothetical protein